MSTNMLPLLASRAHNRQCHTHKTPTKDPMRAELPPQTPELVNAAFDPETGQTRSSQLAHGRHAKKTVAIIGTRGYPSYYGGFETAVRQLAPYLVDHGWGVTVYGREGSTRPGDPERDPRVSSVATKGFETKSLSTLSYGLSSVLHAIREKPDVALIMNVANGYWLPLLKRAGIPTVVNVDGIEWERAKWGRLAKRAFFNGAKMTAKYADELVFDARAIESRWQRDFGRSGTFIPYGGTPADEEFPIEPGLTHRGYVLLVARFVPENTVDAFFDAVPEIAQQIDVVLVGSTGYGGELDERARALAERFESVRWLGHVSDDRRLHSLWQHAAAYFHGHSVGGTNPALVQAMTLGVPTVARDTSFNREVLPSSAPFVSPEPRAIASELLSLVGDASAQEAQASANLVRAAGDYTWQNVNRAYERAISEASLADRGGPISIKR